MSNQFLLNAWNRPEPIRYHDEVFNLKWLRSAANINYSRPNLWFKLGDIGSGKSSEQEMVGLAYAKRGAKILDLQSAHDNENLAWLRAPEMQEKRILLTTGERTKYEFSKKRYEQKKLSEVNLEDIETYDLIVNAYAAYEDADEYYKVMNPFLRMIYEKRLYWHSVIYCIIREAADLAYSRIKNYEDSKQAKSQFVYMLRQSRHTGLALSVDTLRYKSIEVDVRRPAHYISIKSQGLEELPDSLRWLYFNYGHPDWISNMRPNEVLLVCKENSAIGRGFVSYPKFHKEEHENILEILGLHPVTNYSAPSYQDSRTEPIDPERDARHKEIVEKYEDLKISEDKVAVEVGFKSKTVIHTTLNEHETKLAFSGVCDVCERAGGKYARKSVRRSRSDAQKLANIEGNEL